jgi:Kef-type K+ transport system membrane component KefB
MQTDIIPLLLGLVIFLASLISIRLGFSVAIIEILLGAVSGNLNLIHTEPWMTYIATLGGIILTFLAGTEIDTDLMKANFKGSFLIGLFSFVVPFLGIGTYTYFVVGWSLSASMIAGTALSTTSLAVVYSVLVETGLCKTEIGKLIMAATFFTDMGTAIALSILFIRPTVYTAAFIGVSILVIALATRYSHLLFDNPRIRAAVVEPEVKFVFLLLLIFIYFAGIGDGQAVLPTFLLGLFMGRSLVDRGIALRLRTIAYAVITPIFFIVGGMNVSIAQITGAIGLFVALLVIKVAMKFAGVYLLARKYIPGGSMYTTLLMSTGLTFGTIASVFGLSMGYIDAGQYSLLIGVVIASAVIPTFIAQKWFAPVHSEDVTVGRHTRRAERQE